MAIVFIEMYHLGTQDYLKNVKNEIIKWIKDNEQKFLEFFGDDEHNNIISQEYLILFVNHFLH